MRSMNLSKSSLFWGGCFLLCILGGPWAGASARVVASVGSESAKGAALLSVSDPFIRDVITWVRLQRNLDVPDGTLRSFLLKRSGWPASSAFQARLEKFWRDEGAPKDVLSFFNARPPVSPDGKILYLQALQKAGRKTLLKRDAPLYWRKTPMSEDQDKVFLKVAKPYLTRTDHEERLMFLLRARDVAGARRVLSLVSGATRAWGKICVSLLEAKNRAPKVRSLMHGGHMDELTAWCYMRYLVRTKQFRRVHEVFAYLPKKLQDPELFYTLRIMSARELLELGRYGEAVRLLQNHQIPPRQVLMYSDLQWHLGWIWFSFLGKPEHARPYFQKFLRVVKTPISVSRAHYWLGRVAEAEGKTQLSREHYQKAAAYKGAFYGQIASHKIGVRPTPILHDLPVVATADRRALDRMDLVRAARMFSKLGDDGQIYTKMFLQSLAPRMKTPGMKKALLHLAHDLHASVVVDIARAYWIQGNGFPLFKVAYPMCKLPNIPKKDKAIALAIIYKETRFDPYVIGDAGEKGVMQVMPHTAQLEAKALGISHSPHKLSDSAHNILIGMAHVRRHQKRFDLIPLMVSAYNAGGEAVSGWEKRILGPGQVVFRKKFPKFVDYYINVVESVPYESTRGYVQRFLEALAIYRSRLGLPFKLEG